MIPGPAAGAGARARCSRMTVCWARSRAVAATAGARTRCSYLGRREHKPRTRGCGLCKSSPQLLDRRVE